MASQRSSPISTVSPPSLQAPHSMRANTPKSTNNAAASVSSPRSTTASPQSTGTSPTSSANGVRSGGVTKRRASHPCTRCGKPFTKRSNMLIHERLHTGERPYVCRYHGCGRAYKWLSSINFHEGRCDRRAFGLASATTSSSATHHSLIDNDPGSPVTPQRVFSGELVLPPTAASVRSHLPQHSQPQHAHHYAPPMHHKAHRPHSHAHQQLPTSPQSIAALEAPLQPLPQPSHSRFVQQRPQQQPHQRQQQQSQHFVPLQQHTQQPRPAVHRDLHLPLPLPSATPHPTVPPPPHTPTTAAYSHMPPPPQQQGLHAPSHSHPQLQPPVLSLQQPPAPSFTHIAPQTHPVSQSQPQPQQQAQPLSHTATTDALPASATEEEYGLHAGDLFVPDGQACTIAGGVLDELTAASISLESDAAHSEVLLF